MRVLDFARAAERSVLLACRHDVWQAMVGASGASAIHRVMVRVGGPDVRPAAGAGVVVDGAHPAVQNGLLGAVLLGNTTLRLDDRVELRIVRVSVMRRTISNTVA